MATNRCDDPICALGDARVCNGEPFLLLLLLLLDTGVPAGVASVTAELVVAKNAPIVVLHGGGETVATATAAAVAALPLPVAPLISSLLTSVLPTVTITTVGGEGGSNVAMGDICSRVRPNNTTTYYVDKDKTTNQLMTTSCG
jgi:hypothetical protein